jgi:hypothetical protein
MRGFRFKNTVLNKREFFKNPKTYQRLVVFLLSRLAAIAGRRYHRRQTLAQPKKVPSDKNFLF